MVMEKVYDIAHRDTSIPSVIELISNIVNVATVVSNR